MCTLTTGTFIGEVETVGVAVAFKAFGDAVSAVTLEVARMTRPQL